MKAQQAFYENKWKEVDSLALKMDRTATATMLTNQLYKKAIEEKNYVQQLNAIRHLVFLNSRVEEDAEKAAIRLLEKETPRFKGVYHSIALSFTAEAYWNYLVENEYALGDRTSIHDTSEKDIDKWTAEQLHEKISSLYFQSLSNADALQKTSIEEFEPLLKKGNSPTLRPTVYDLLAHRALEYFYTDDRNTIEPITQFELNDTSLFAGVKSFLDWKPNDTDSTDKKIHSLQILQQLTGFHLGDQDPSALIDVTIERIEFVHEHATLENKDSLYLQALESITSKYPTLPATAQAWYLQAEYHAAIGRTYDPSADPAHAGQETARLSFLKALALCRKVTASTEPSEGLSNCLQLEREITSSMLNVTMEEVVIPGKPSLILLEYRNIDKLYYRIIKQEENYWKKGNDRWKRYDWDSLVKEKYQHSIEQKLPAPGDYQLHRVEAMIKALEPGQYSILFSTSPDFPVDSLHILSAIDFQVSSIALINQSADNFIVDRASGMAVSNAIVNIYRWGNKATSDTLGYYLASKQQPDKNGWFSTRDTSKDNYSRKVIEITNKTDRLLVNTYTGYTRYEDEERKIQDQEKFEAENRQVFYFTDRAIYRPGQIVEFKGLVTTKDALTREPKIEAGFKTFVSLYDANDEVIDSIEVSTNKFGSFYGKFQLPANSLNGAFSISSYDVRGSADFSVEEYKRPKFSVELQLPGETFKVNDLVKLQGKAVAYAGNAISNAKVRYRVTRTSMLPIWMRYIFSRFPGRDEKEIINGFTTTDEAGNFMMEFNAVPDKKIDSSLSPVFHYKVSADVTDINGETHSDIQFIKAGYDPFILDIPGDMDWNDHTIPSLTVEAQNMNGRKIHADITATIIPLQEPSRIMRKRLWSKPDQFIMSETEFTKNFPLDIYNNEDQFSTWKEEKVLQVIKDTANKKLVLYPRPLKQGWYLLRLEAKDSLGQLVSTKTYFNVTGAKVMTGPAFATIVADSSSIEVGEELKYSVQTNLPQARIVLQEISNDSAGDFQFRIKNNEPLMVTKKITAPDQGIYRIIMATVKDNRFYTDDKNIQIPFVGKELEVKLETYRDKTLPGSAEKWTLSVENKKGNPVQAELVSVLYDESLDQLRMHQWYKPSLWTKPLNAASFTAPENFSVSNALTKPIELPELEHFEKSYDNLIYSPYERRYTADIIFNSMKPEMMRMTVPKIAPSSFDEDAEDDSTATETGNDERIKTSNPPRKDFRETAYFIPQLITDENGKAEISFTIPEALTRWKSISFAHTSTLAMGMTEASIITQKSLMVQPNMPRFLREGDRIDLVTKIVNMTDKEMTGQVELQLVDPETNQPVDGWFRNFFPNQYFTAAAGESVAASFSIEVPYLYGKPVIYRVYARSGNITDAEEGFIPVLTNRVLVTETMAIAMQKDTVKKLQFTNLLKSDSSENLTHHKLTVEYTANPSWLVVQSLPYLEQKKNGSSSEVFGRIYANAIAAKVLRTNPAIEQVMKSWSSNDTGYLGKLEQNQELKNILLQQTPWVFEAKQESARQRGLLKLFDVKANVIALDEAIAELRNLQQDDGAFSWMPKGPSDRFITQEILIGIGRLLSLNAVNEKQQVQLSELAKKALPYTHEQIIRDYEEAKKSKSVSLHTIQLHYLYMLTYYQQWGVTATALPAFNFYRKLTQKQWIKLNRYGQAVAALFLSRTGDKNTAAKIIRALQENAIHHPELGMYWKETTGGYYWYQSAIEAQAFIIEAFHELNAPKEQVTALKTWLLKNRQTNNWGNVSATADACYALLTTGDDWLKTSPVVTFRLGDLSLQSSDTASNGMPGYFKTSIEGSEIKPSMGNIEVTLHSDKPVEQPSWGAVYWQYFEDMNQVKSSSGALKMERKVFVERNSEKGPVLEPVTEGQMLKIGDRLKVVISINSDRAMEYIHISDMRAAALEPSQVISGYTWKGSLGYYQSTHDASTDFFIDHLPKGHHQLEYPLVVTNAGTFSNGLTKAQCMYAPEFISYAEGVRIMVENN